MPVVHPMDIAIVMGDGELVTMDAEQEPLSGITSAGPVMNE